MRGFLTRDEVAATFDVEVELDMVRVECDATKSGRCAWGKVGVDNGVPDGYLVAGYPSSTRVVDEVRRTRQR